MKLTINRQIVDVPDALREEMLLYVLRDHLRLTGTKFGCGVGLCGACTVHLNGVAARSCQIYAEDAVGAEITTIEGLAATSARRDLHPLQQAWIDEAVPQCGYCQAGQIMNAAALLNANPSPSSEEISEKMNGNLCRCGTYGRIRKAILRAAEDMQNA